MVKPPFAGPFPTIGFVVSLAFLLALPVLMAKMGLKSREQMYKGVPGVFGNPAYIEGQIYDDFRNPDLLFVGSSRTTAAIQPEKIKEFFRPRLGRDPIVAILDQRWDGPDLEYVMLKDYLSNHQPKLIIFEAPNAPTISNKPHRLLSSLVRYGEVDQYFPYASLADRVSIYAEQVIRGPRQLLDYLRPNVVSDDEKGELNRNRAVTERFWSTSSPGSLSSASEPAGVPFVAVRLEHAKVKEEGKQFKPSRYFSFVLSAISTIADQRHIPILLIDMPTQFDFGKRDDAQMIDLARFFGTGTNIIAPSARDLFGELPETRVRTFYNDHLHLNYQGSQAYMQGLLPALYHEYRQAVQRK
jgi:hypothetical protein